MSQSALLHRRMLPMAVFGVCVFGFHASPSLAEAFSRGQALYENHCQSCHADWAHTRSGRKVASAEELNRRVAAWSVHAGLNWSAEEIRDVADYLERNFYHFEAQP
jgi:mono/diheme cytochrome c family protein